MDTNRSAYIRFDDLQRAMAEKGMQIAFSDPLDAAVQIQMFLQATISYYDSKRSKAMGPKISPDDDMIRAELVSQVTHIDEICDQYGVEHIFTGSVDSTADLDAFAQEFCQAFSGEAM